MQKHAGGLRGIITPQEARMAKRNRKATSSQILADIAISTVTHISARIISRLLNQIDSYERKTVQHISFQALYRLESLL